MSVHYIPQTKLIIDATLEYLASFRFFQSQRNANVQNTVAEPKSSKNVFKKCPIIPVEREPKTELQIAG